jgi:hypothetical protein
MAASAMRNATATVRRSAVITGAFWVLFALVNVGLLVHSIQQSSWWAIIPAIDVLGGGWLAFRTFRTARTGHPSVG